jgi:ATP-dependent Lon protease
MTEPRAPQPGGGTAGAGSAGEPGPRPQDVAPPGPEAIPDVLPILPLPDTVFPHAVTPMAIGQPEAVRLVDDATRANRMIGLVARRDPEAADVGPDDVYQVGSAAAILQLARLPDGSLRMAVQGLERIRILEFTATEPYLLARVEVAPDVPSIGPQVEGLQRAVIELLHQFAAAPPGLPEPVLAAAEQLTDPRDLLYLAASVINLPRGARQELLELDPLEAKLRRLIELLQHERSIREIGRKITTETQERLSKAQREMLLREQLKSIQAELGETDTSGLAELRRQLEEAGLPPEARAEADRELSRLESIPDVSPEHGMIRTYLDWMASLPWSKLSGADIDVARARAVLDEDHYDLEKVKERILEHLAVRKLRRDRLRETAGDGGAGQLPPVVEAPAAEAPPAPGVPPDRSTTPDPGDAGTREPILCFVGPPGVGKTSLGQSIARALGREFVRMSLGGIHDEAEIRGHRRTYIGALPGRIIQGLRRIASRDPVFMLDEIDKVSSDWRGDPTAALLEVLDPAQNRAFVDTYLAVPFDLSQVFFIATANTLDTIPAPLRDRMEVLTIAGYTEDEKVQIAARYLVPQQRRANGLREDELEIPLETLRHVARAYTREAGVRDLDRQIATIARKVARRLSEGGGGESGATAPGVIEPDELPRLLGPQRFYDEVAERTQRPGVATGLAWTPVGGEVLFVEAAVLPRDGGGDRLLLTGQLGDVMRESAQAALTYLLSDGPRLGIDTAPLAERMVHVHVPAGASPKDGPSAGVAMLAAMASVASGRPVHGDVAMTGEITLRGKVLPVGGIKEKLLAAHRAGIRRVCIPRRNEADLDDLPAEIRKDLEIQPIDTADEVLRAVLEPTVVEPPAGDQPGHGQAAAPAAVGGGDGAGAEGVVGRRVAPRQGQAPASSAAMPDGVTASRSSRPNRSRGPGPKG